MTSGPIDTAFPSLAFEDRHVRLSCTPVMKHGPYAMSGMSSNGSARIDVGDAASLLRWSLRFHMTERRLVEVVALVGTMANAVECYVGSRGYKP